MGTLSFVFLLGRSWGFYSFRPGRWLVMSEFVSTYLMLVLLLTD